MSLFSRACGVIKLNPQVLFFDGHDRHFNDRATHLLQSHHTFPFTLKAGNSINDHPNNNGPNLNLKRYYGIVKLKWQRQHGTMKFTPAHMNYVLVEMWHYFQLKPDSITIDALKKTKLLSLSPPDFHTNAQACLGATQTPFGAKLEDTEDIYRSFMAPGQVKNIRTTD